LAELNNILSVLRNDDNNASHYQLFSNPSSPEGWRKRRGRDEEFSVRTM